MVSSGGVLILFEKQAPAFLRFCVFLYFGYQVSTGPSIPVLGKQCYLDPRNLTSTARLREGVEGEGDGYLGNPRRIKSGR